MRAILALCIGIGAVHLLMAPPRGDAGWIGLQPLVWIPAIHLFSRLRPRSAFFAGWLLGTVANVAIYEWLTETLDRFTALPPLAGWAVLLLFATAAGFVMAVFAWGVRPIRSVSGAWWPFAVAAWFVACEHFTPQFFPYAQGSGWISVPHLYLVAVHTGIGGVTFLVFLVSGFGVIGLEWLLDERASSGRRAALPAACAAGLLGLAVLSGTHQLGRIEEAEAKATPLRVALVQDNLLREEGLALSRRDSRAVARLLVDMTEATLASDPSIEVVVWPEAALRREPTHPWSEPALAMTRRHDIELWTGANTRAGDAADRKAFNAAYRVRGGSQDVPYYKNVPVPISEAMPQIAWLEGLPGMVGAIDGTGGISAGDGPGVFSTRWGRVAFVICYEAILDDPMRASVNEGASLLANFTYEGWFGNTRELDQHLAMARTQVAQLGVPMVRAATTGLTALIDARGRILAEAPRFERSVLVGDIRPVRVPGLYAHAGPWFARGTGLASAALLFVGLRRGGRWSRDER